MLLPSASTSLHINRQEPHRPTSTAITDLHTQVFDLRATLRRPQSIRRGSRSTVPGGTKAKKLAVD